MFNVQARYKQFIRRYSQGERRRARYEQDQLRWPGHRRASADQPSAVMRTGAGFILFWVFAWLFVLLSGCSSLPGVQISDNERKACEAEGCSVWTDRELERLAKSFFQKGYTAGMKSL